MDTAEAFVVALDHYRKGNELLNPPAAMPVTEIALHTARATAHFCAGSLALALARAQQAGSAPED